MTVILGRVDPTGTSCHGLCDVCQSTAALAGGTQRAALFAWLYKTHGNGIFTRCPSKVVVVAKETGGWQKRQNKRDRTPHPPHLPPKAVRGDMGHGSAAGRGPTADAQGDLATVPRALQVPGQGRQPVRELPHPWYPRSLGTPAASVPTDTMIPLTALVPPDITVPPAALVPPATPAPPASPLELVVPQDAAVGELDDGRVRDGFVGRHRGTAGAGGNREPSRCPAQGAGTGRAGAGPGRGSGANGCRGTGQPVRGGGTGAPPRGQAEGQLPPLPGFLPDALRNKPRGAR